MELCQLKLYGRIIDLEVGDTFWTNGSYFAYEPKGKNTSLIPRGGDRWARSTHCSCVKYEKEVRKADNIKQLPKRGNCDVWRVEYVYKQDRPQYDALIVMKLSKDNGFEVFEAEVEKETKELIWFKQHHPVTCHSTISKSDLLKGKFVYLGVYNEWYGSTHITCRVDDYAKAQDFLFEHHEMGLEIRIKHTRQKLINEQKELKKFTELKIKQGYNATKI